MSTAAFDTTPTQTASAAPARQGFDWPLALVAVAQMSAGMLMILSASWLFADARYGTPLHFGIRHGMGVVVGLVATLVLLRLSWARLRSLAWPAYLATVFALMLVLTPLAHSANGATRWISVGPVNFQPSEASKLALIFVLAQFLAGNEGRMRDVVGVVVPAFALILLPPVVLVMAQPDFGTTVILAGLFGVMLFLAGLQWRWVFALGGAALVSLGALAIAAPYRLRRLMNFFDPFADAEGAGYQVVQGWIALASGGLTGRGLGTGQAQSGFLPEAHTDFISAVVGEEFGAVGFAVLVASYIFVIWRGSLIAARAVDLFGNLLAMGVTTLLASQAIINLGVVVGLVPPKGLVLPFFSYGASAVMIHLICVGLLLRVSMERPAATGRPA